ncbi:hypothetical protein [Lactococcus lactis]|uniref:Uncharacterized protein n=1 Tax=Lactococcus lactis subsp. lactis A12 TaxID=1137134 RepID=S6FG34_LACLL|nr:hypothetical protein [Lactococcus lactis]CDG04256.1 Putative uncharacterized protein [Lactococcus lactis subsp. lactis A12]SBW30166.1 Hypothetical protein LLA12_01013 [Lactococcus lactis subsp. lactis]
MEEDKNIKTTAEIHEPDQPIDNKTDMVDLLVMVVDDLCVQIGDLKERIDNAQD